MSKHLESIWTVCCASNSISPTCGQSYGPIASSILLRAVLLLLGGNASDPAAQAKDLLEIHPYPPFGSSCFPFVLGRRPPVCLSTMDTILRLLEGLRRDEIVWLNTYLTGRLRAMPPPAAAAATAQVSAGPAHADIAGDSVDELPAVALAERVGDFNISMDPWEQTGAAPQGWATRLHQTVIPVQGYIQLRPHDTTLPSFGGGPPATAETANENLPTEVAVREGGGKASPSVSIFSRAPLCSNTCRHCRSKPCDIATDHDDHICYNCHQTHLES